MMALVKAGKKFYLYLAAVCVTALLHAMSGCGSSEEPSPDEPMLFDVIDSLLGKEVAVEEAGIRLFVPVDFEPAPDTVMYFFRGQIMAQMADDSLIDPVGCYIDTARQAGVILSLLDGIYLNADTGRFVDRYRRSLHDTFGPEKVREGDYWVDSVFVRNFLITHGGIIRFQLLCEAGAGETLEAVYFASQEYYPSVIKHFESSIGTLKHTVTMTE